MQKHSLNSKVSHFILQRFSLISWLIFSFLAIVSLSCVYLFLYFTSDLPDYDQLAAYDPSTITRLYSHEGNVIAEYSHEKRIFTPYKEIPQIIIYAFLAAEDKNFFDHSGVDLLSIIRATVQSIINISSNKRMVGASTITQQVARYFLLTNERTIGRKIKEAVLAYRITKAYSKERILELYLNQIFLGNKSYGIAAAAHNYFDKELSDLNIEEAAMIAALPKAPSDLNPYSNYSKAKIRRDWVIERMKEEGFIQTNEALKAISSSIILNQKNENDKKFDESFYSEAVRKELLQTYGENVVYNRGLIVNINIDEKLQQYADKALRNGIVAYDRKYGWRGPIGKIKINKGNWHDSLLTFSENDKTNGTENYIISVIIGVKEKEAEIGLIDGSTGIIKLEKILWAKKSLSEQTVGSTPKKISDVLNIGDVVLVSKSSNDVSYKLEQIPEVNGAMVVLQPYTGKILAMVGGYSSNNNFFNRAIQAKRQPGSLFKPLVYLTALESGYNTETILHDEPMSISQGKGMPLWTPKNYTKRYMGPVPLNIAFAKSLNLPVVELIMSLGVQNVLNTAIRLGIYKNLNLNKINATYSMALGAFETTLLDITNAYNTIASSGFETKPKLIDSIYDRYGELLYRDKDIVCNGCDHWIDPEQKDENLLPNIQYFRNKLIKERYNKQMLYLLREAIINGTGAKAKVLGKDIAGKTGTTNDSFDTWFIGFSHDFTVGIYLGFDSPKTLGQKETGSTSPLPIFVNFMENALLNRPNISITEKNKVIEMVDISGDNEDNLELSEPLNKFSVFDIRNENEINDIGINSEKNSVNIINKSPYVEGTVNDLTEILRSMKND